MLVSPAIGPVQLHLTFHGVGRPSRALDPGEEVVWLSTECFEAALDAVRERPDVRISFDDSNRSDLEIALPALRRRDLTATFFVLGGRLEHPAHLSADDVRTLRDEGMAVGTHGMDHVDWRAAGDAALERELGHARRRLEAICGHPISSVSVPFGRYDRRVLAALRRFGYTTVYTSDGGPARAGAWLMARQSLRRDDGPAQLAAVLSPDRSGRAVAARRIKGTVKRWR